MRKMPVSLLLRGTAHTKPCSKLPLNKKFIILVALALIGRAIKLLGNCLSVVLSKQASPRISFANVLVEDLLLTERAWA